MDRLKPGDRAPAFKLLDQQGNTVQLSDFEGEKVLLFFYPRADTPGCTRQSCSVSEQRHLLGRSGIKALGISPDQPERQQRFADKYGLAIPLLSDPDGTVARAYGAWGEKRSGGRVKEGIIRSSFLIAGDGQILGAWYKVKPEETVDRALEAGN